MPDLKYQQDTQRMFCRGLGLNSPVDKMPEGFFPFLKNVRSTILGEITNRPGVADLGVIVAGQTPLHSIRNLVLPRLATSTHILGVGTHLAGYSVFGLVADIDSGYSGDPLSLVPYRPSMSPDPWMYVGDRSRMRKTTGSLIHTVGLPAPANAPTSKLGTPSYKLISDFDNTGVWANTGNAGAPTLLSAGPGYRTTGTIAQILYDTGTTGWCLVSLTSMAGVGVGERLNFNPGGGSSETVVVQEVHPVSLATTIGSIIYDVGTSGLCSLVLATAVVQPEVNSLIRNTTVGPENVRILAVITGPDGTTSLRLSTTNTWAATNAVQVLASLRTFTPQNHAGGETVRIDGIRTAVTTGAPGYLRDTAAFDLSLLATGIPTTPDDLMHISFRTDRPDLVTELKVQLDVDPTINDFTRNFYTYTLRAGDLTPAVRNLATLIATRQTVIQRTIIDSPIVIRDTLPGNFNALTFGDQVLALENLGFSPDDATQLVVSGVAQATAEQQGGLPSSTGEFGSNTAVSSQLGLGDIQWSEIQFSLGQLTRVGTDMTRTLANVAAIQLVFTTSGNVNFDMDSWWIGGGYGPDTTDPTTTPYLYRFRARHPLTNVASNWSPSIRGGLDSFRQSVTVTMTQYPIPSGFSGVATDFVLDIARYGGSNPSWHYAGTVANSATPSFTDIYPDSSIAGNPDSLNDNYQPWPIEDIPTTGTTGSVSGTTVNDSGTTFNLSWAPGNRILINSVAYTIYRVISTSRLELVENAGTQSSVTWRIDSPTLLAQPLPCLWVFDDTFFACGDLTNPGRLYYSKRAFETTQLSFINPDGTSVTWGYIDVTSPSEPLMNGIPFNARNMLFSSDRLFEVLPTSDPAHPWTFREIPNGIGLFSRWGLPIYGLKGPFIPFLGRDGIYKTDGGSPVSITDRDLFPLFPNEGNQGINVNGVPSPNIVAANAAVMRLEFYGDYVYFSYKDQTEQGVRHTLVYSAALDGWFYDTPGVALFYGEEGTLPSVNSAGAIHAIYIGGADTTSAHLYQFTGNSDAGLAINCEVLTPSRDQDAPREQKLYGDIMMDLDPQGRTITMTPEINGNSSSLTATTTALATRSQVVVSTYIPATSSWQTARNVSLDILWTVIDANHPILYIWEPRWTFTSVPIIALSWEIAPTSFGKNNFKYLGFYRITHLSTADLTLTVIVDGVAQTPITITNGSGIQAMTVGRFPVYKGKLYAIRITSSTPFQLDTRDTFIEVKEWAEQAPFEELRVFSDFANVQG